MEGIILRLEQGNIDDIELSVIDLGPAQFMELLETLDYERIDWDTNGWEQDTWYNFRKEGYPSLCLYYSGYTGEIRLYMKDEDEDA